MFHYSEWLIKCDFTKTFAHLGLILKSDLMAESAKCCQWSNGLTLCSKKEILGVESRDFSQAE